jgi:hypothetical protein
MKNVLSMIGIGIGLLLVLGSAGSLEFNSIGWCQFFIQSIIGIGLVWGGLVAVDK